MNDNDSQLFEPAKKGMQNWFYFEILSHYSLYIRNATHACFQASFKRNISLNLSTYLPVLPLLPFSQLFVFETIFY